MFFAACALLGAIWGGKIGAEYGPLGILPGVVAGTMAWIVCGIVLYVVFALLVTLICWPFSKFWRWWRPYPPVCENGTCKGFQSYEYYHIPDEMRADKQWIACLGLRCECGNIYVGGIGYGVLNRWFRLLPDGTIRPYLKHRVLGRWQPDVQAEVIPPKEPTEKEFIKVMIKAIAVPGLISLFAGYSFSLDILTALGLALLNTVLFLLLFQVIAHFFGRKSENGEMRIPDWGIIVLTTLPIFSISFSFLIVEGKLNDQIGRWLVLGVTLLGFLFGYGAYYVRTRKQSKKDT